MPLDRLKEPSTWAALAAALVGLGINIPSAWVQGLSMILAGAAALAGILMPEKKA